MWMLHCSFSLLLNTWFDVFFTEMLQLEKQLDFDFKCVRVSYFNIDLRMSSLSNKWEPFF